MNVNSFAAFFYASTTTTVEGTVNIMRIHGLLDDDTRRKLDVNVHSSMTRKQYHHEQLTKDDLDFLMGIFKQTYTKKNGRVRQK